MTEVSTKTHSQSSPLSQLVYLIAGIISFFLISRFKYFLGLSVFHDVNFLYRFSVPLARTFYGLSSSTLSYAGSKVVPDSLATVVVVTIVALIVDTFLLNF
jgi:hypothetical protein